MKRVAMAAVLALAGLFMVSCECTTGTCPAKKQIPGYVKAGEKQGMQVAPKPQKSEAKVVEAPTTGKTPYQLSQEELERQRMEAERRRLEAQKAKEAEAKAEELQRLMELVHKDIHFAFDSYTLSEEAKEILGAVAEYLHQHPNLSIRIEGNCDERGSTRYNLALGEKRANAAKEYLGYLGIDPSRIDTVSYGEEKPLCTEHTEECWAKNRRDHIVIIGE